MRLGLWDDAIAVQRGLGGGRARPRAARPHPGATSFDELHALDYLAYAYLQQGQDDKAREILDRVARGQALDNPHFAAAYALAAVPARYALERGQWTEAAALEVGAGLVPVGHSSRTRRRSPAFARADRRGAQRRHPRARRQRAGAARRAAEGGAVDAKIAYWAGPDRDPAPRGRGVDGQAEGRKDEAVDAHERRRRTSRTRRTSTR